MSPLAIRPEHRPDGELVELARNGDAPAMEALIRRHYDAVHAVCRRILGHDADALDATQNALLAVSRGIRRFDGTSAFTTWAYRVATNAALDELRRRKRRPEPTEFVDRLGDGGSGRSGVTLIDAQSPHDERTSTRVDLDRALAKLPLDFRTVVVLRDLCGLDYAEIAEIVGIPGGTVRSRIARGRMALLPLLGNSSTDPQRRTTSPEPHHD